MNTLKFIFPNFRLIFWELCFGLLAYITHPAFCEPVDKYEYITAIAIFVIAVIVMIGYLILSPHFFVFDEKGVRIYYILGLKKSATWENIRHIRKWFAPTRRSLQTVYEISPMEGRALFFMDNYVNKTWYIRRVIEHYWDGTIEDDSFFARMRRNRSAPRSTVRAESEERAVKTAVHDVLKRYRKEYESVGVMLNVSVSYDGEEKRPASNYDYTATLILKGQNNEQIENIDISVLRVIRGKKEYRPIHLKSALDEVEEILKEELAILKKVGCDEFFSEI